MPKGSEISPSTGVFLAGTGRRIDTAMPFRSQAKLHVPRGQLLTAALCSPHLLLGLQQLCSLSRLLGQSRLCSSLLTIKIPKQVAFVIAFDYSHSLFITVNAVITLSLPVFRRFFWAACVTCRFVSEGSTSQFPASLPVTTFFSECLTCNHMHSVY